MPAPFPPGFRSLAPHHIITAPAGIGPSLTGEETIGTTVPHVHVAP